MFKKSILLGAVAGLCAGIACIGYAKVYGTAMDVDYSKVVKPVGMVSACVFGCMLAAIGYLAFTKLLKKNGEIVFNLVFVLLSFASIYGVFAATLPLDVQSPELFPGFATPMHFFPALAWFTLKPLFFKQ